MLDLLQRLFGKHPDWDGKERRRTLRARCSVEVQVGGGGHEFAARVTELGLQGLRLETNAPINPKLKPGVVLTLHARSQSGGPMVGKLVRVRSRGTGSNLAVKLDPAKPLSQTWARPVLEEAVRSEPRQKRRYIRVRADWIVEATYEGVEHEVRVRDLSVGGARLECREPLQVGRTVHLKMANMAVQAEVRQVSQIDLNYLIGVRFHPDQPHAEQMLELVRKLCQP